MSYYTNALFSESFSEPEVLSHGLNCASMIDIPEHRSGWNYVKRLCVTHLHDPNGPILVDFVEKIWCWKEFSETKDIYYNNQNYVIRSKDLKMIDGKEYAVLSDDVAVYWNGQEWARSDQTHEYIDAADTYGVFTRPWVGMVHNPMNMPKWFDYGNSPQELVKKPDFQKSMKHCLGMIVFSESLKHQLTEIMPGVPIHVLTHPTEPVGTRWKLSKKTWFPLCRVLQPGTHKKRLVQVGYWLRKLTSIWEVQVPDGWTKHWINRAEHGFRCLEKEIYHEQKGKRLTTYVEIMSLSDKEYDTFLSESVMFIDLYDSSCNNTILEAIVRHVPIVARRLPATEEYLGSDYSLFFDSLEIVPLLLSPERLARAHHQLKALEESGRFYGERFVEDMQSVVKTLESHHSVN